MLNRNGRVSCAGCGNNTKVDEAILAWRDRLGVSFEDAFRVLNRFWREALSKHPVFGDMTPSELVEWQANAKGRDAYVQKGLARS